MLIEHVGGVPHRYKGAISTVLKKSHSSNVFIYVCRMQFSQAGTSGASDPCDPPLNPATIIVF